MTSEEILGMARSAGFEQVMRHADGSSTVLPTELFVRFYELAAIHTLATQNNRNEFVDFRLLQKEHSARIAAQAEVAELKEKLLKSGVDAQNAAHAARRLLAALDKLDEGCNCPGFNGWQNGHGEDVGDEAQEARESLEAITGHKRGKP